MEGSHEIQKQANSICQRHRGDRHWEAPRIPPSVHADHPPETPHHYSTGQQGEWEPINRGKFVGTGGSPIWPGESFAGCLCRGWQEAPAPEGRAGWIARWQEGPVLQEGQAGGKHPGPQGRAGGSARGWRRLSPGTGRLALRGRVAHRVLISTKSLQRWRTRVLLLFSYLQNPEVTGSDRSSLRPRGRADLLDKAVSHPAGTP